MKILTSSANKNGSSFKKDEPFLLHTTTYISSILKPKFSFKQMLVVQDHEGGLFVDFFLLPTELVLSIFLTNSAIYCDNTAEFSIKLITDYLDRLSSIA